MDDKPKLLPCPFCGGEPRLSCTRDESLWSHAEVLKTSVRCDGCDIATDYTEAGQDPEAIEKWNTRSSPPPQEATDNVRDVAEQILAAHRDGHDIGHLIGLLEETLRGGTRLEWSDAQPEGSE